MSRSIKIGIVVVIAIIVVGGIWWGMSLNPAANPEGAAGTPANGPSVALTSGTADADLNQDLATVDAQLNGLASDSAIADQGLSDQAVTQSQL